MLNPRLLEKLEEAIAICSPTLAGCLNKGISVADLKQQESQLLPYFLPEECQELYRWRDGAAHPLELIPGFAFLSLAQAIEEYRLQFQLDGGSEGWNPLWFPIFSFQGDNYCVLLSKERRVQSEIYLSHNQDTEIWLMHPDLNTLLDVSAECFSAGAYYLDDGFIDMHEEHVDEIFARFGSSAFKGSDASTSYSKAFTKKWPQEWKDAIGRIENDYKLKGADNTVSAYLQKPKRSRFHACIIGLIGTAEEMRLTIEDATAVMTVYCPRTVIGARETQITRRYEMEIAPFVATTEVAEGCDGIVKHMILMD